MVAKIDGLAEPDVGAISVVRDGEIQDRCEAPMRLHMYSGTAAAEKRCEVCA